MTPIELLKYIFDGVEGEFAVFRNGGDETLLTVETLDEGFPQDATVAEMMLLADNLVVGVPVTDPAVSTFKITKGKDVFHFALFKDPVPESEIPDTVTGFDIHVDGSWEIEITTDTFFGFDEVFGTSGGVTQSDSEVEDAQVALEDEGVAGEQEPGGSGLGGGGEAGASSDRAEAEESDAGDSGWDAASGPDDVAAEGDAGGEPVGDADLGGGPAVEPEYLNDAVILGVETDAFNAILEQPATLLTGELWGAKDRRNTQDNEWNPVTMPWAAWVVGGPGDKNTAPWGFSRHPVGKDKAGACIVLGSSIGRARKAKAMETMYAMGIDVDAGFPLDLMLDRLEELGLFCLVYTSHSHGKSGLQLKHDEVIRKLKIKPSELNKAQVQRFLREFDKNRYEESFINQIEIVHAKKQVKDGVVIELSTPPLDKYRLIFPLAEPVKLIDLAGTQAEALEVWENKITGLATETLGVHFDTSCTDPSRLFYTARHAKDAADWYCAIVRGDPLRFEDVPTVKKTSYTSSRKPMNAFEMAGGVHEEADRPPQCLTPSGASLNDWHYKAKDRFQMADLLEDLCADRIRVAGGEAQGHVHIECPFEHEHTSEGGTATMAVNALDSQNGYWTWFCHHDACQGRHKLEFLEEALRQGWFEEEQLSGDSVYMLEGADEEDEEEDAEEDSAEAEDIEVTPKSLPEMAEAFDPDASEEDILKFLKKCLRGGVDKVEQAKILTALSKRTPLGKSVLNKMWNGLVAEQRQKERERAKKEEPVELEQAVGLVNDWHFADLCAHAHRAIHDRNQASPSVFHYMEGLYVIREDSEGHARMKLLDRDGFAHHLNTVAAFAKVGGEDGSELRGVSAPDDVVRHLFAGDYGTYPELRGLVTTPIFTTSGAMLTTPGYDWDSRLYYRPDLSLSVPNVSTKPSEDEVFRAKQLLIEEILADFPLGGLTRPEIVEKGLHGEGVPAVTNMMGLMVLPFMRELIDGPTPGHLLTKPAPGTGASLLTDVFSIIATGRETPALAMPTSKDEMSKTLTSVLANGQNIVFFDNINHSVDSGELASAMTAPTYQARILGKSQTVEVAVRTTWVFTGNNVSLSSELVRRLIMIDLDAQVANPELRTGFRHKDIRGWAKENRGELVWACLTLIQNWIAKGMPVQKDTALASYENWSGVVGGVLKEAGMGGFLQNRDALKEKASDEDNDSIAFLLEAWWGEVANRAIYLRGDGTGSGSEAGLIDIAIAREVTLPIRRERTADGEMGYNVANFGKWLGMYKGRVYKLEDGTEVKIERDGKRTSRGFKWNLTVLNRNLKGNVKV